MDPQGSQIPQTNFCGGFEGCFPPLPFHKDHIDIQGSTEQEPGQDWLPETQPAPCQSLLITDSHPATPNSSGHDQEVRSFFLVL